MVITKKAAVAKVPKALEVESDPAMVPTEPIDIDPVLKAPIVSQPALPAASTPAPAITSSAPITPEAKPQPVELEPLKKAVSPISAPPPKPVQKSGQPQKIKA